MTRQKIGCPSPAQVVGGRSAGMACITDDVALGALFVKHINYGTLHKNQP